MKDRNRLNQSIRGDLNANESIDAGEELMEMLMVSVDSNQRKQQSVFLLIQQITINSRNACAW